MKILKHIFSISNDDVHKVIEIMGIKFKIYSCKLAIRKQEKAIQYLKTILDCTADITQSKPAKGTFRQLQIVRLKALKLVIKILEKNNLTYWLDFGTLLGAYRHKGFIPWDDDIDIAIPRDEYEQVKIILADFFKNTKLSFNIGARKREFIARITDLDLFFIYVDIFPYDYSNSQCSKEKLIEKLNDLKVNFYKKYDKKDFWHNKLDNNSIYDKLLEYYNKYKITTNNNAEKTYIFQGLDFHIHNKFKQSVHKIEEVFPLQKMQFEDFMANVPNDVVQYLSDCDEGNYGDIMSFPPMSAMCNHIIFKKLKDHKFQNELYEKEKYIDKLIQQFEKHENNNTTLGLNKTS